MTGLSLRLFLANFSYLNYHISLNICFFFLRAIYHSSFISVCLTFLLPLWLNDLGELITGLWSLCILLFISSQPRFLLLILSPFQTSVSIICPDTSHWALLEQSGSFCSQGKTNAAYLYIITQHYIVKQIQHRQK